MMNASGTKQVSPQTMRLICCAVNACEYGLEMTAVRSIGRLQQLGFQTTVESIEPPRGALGWITAQQNLYPVFDLATQLGLSDLPACPPAPEDFLLLINAAQPFGLRVDRIAGNLTIAATQISPLPHILDPRADKLFKGVVKLKEKWLLCLEAERLNRTEPAPILSLPRTSGLAITPESPASQSAQATPQILLFSPAQEALALNETPTAVFGLSLKQIQAVSPLLPILPIPQSPDYVFGIANWRDMPLPILDLPSRLGMQQPTCLPHQLDPKSRLLIARAPSGLVGIPIHPQAKTFSLPIPYESATRRPVVHPSLVLGIFAWEGKALVIPDLEAILTHNFAL